MHITVPHAVAKGDPGRSVLSSKTSLVYEFLARAKSLNLYEPKERRAELARANLFEPARAFYPYIKNVSR